MISHQTAKERLEAMEDRLTNLSNERAREEAERV